MPYITKYNLFKIIMEFEFYFDEELIEELKEIYPFFSSRDIKILAKYQSILENNENDNFDFYRSNKNDDNFVFKSNPAYHSNLDCKLLSANYENIRVPEKILAYGRLAAKEFLKWANENKYLFNNNIKVFKFRACDRFKEYYLRPNDIEEVYGLNSGPLFIKLKTISSIKTEIQKIISEAKNYYYTSKDHRIILSRFKQRKFLYKNEYEIDDKDYDSSFIKKILKKQVLDFETPLINLHIELLKKLYNKNLYFNNSFLQNLGFTKCPECYSSRGSRNSEKKFTKPITKINKKSSAEISLDYYKMGLSPDEILSIRINEEKPITALSTIEGHIIKGVDQLSDLEVKMCYSKKEERYMLKSLSKKKKIIGLRGAMDLLVDMNISYFALRMFLYSHPEIKITPVKN